MKATERERDEHLGASEDGTLLARAAGGSADASAELVDTYWPEAFRVAVLILRDERAAEDVAQETMLSAIHRAELFENGRPLRPWLVRIATNKALDQARRLSRRPEQPLVDAPEAAGPDPADAYGLQERLESLDPETRAIVALRYVFDYRSHEIAEVIGVSAQAVRTRLSRALATLRVEMEKEVERAC